MLTAPVARLEEVTLYVRVWIETVNKERIAKSTEVTLYVRVWIETNKVLIVFP